MGKKEASKGREWEKGRRDILNQNFQELSKSLPGYSNAINISKKTILTEALAYIRHLEQEKKGCNRCNQITGEEIHECLRLTESAPLVKWILDIVNKVYQLATILKSSGIHPPQELVSFDAPPILSDKLRLEIVAEIEKIGPQTTLKTREFCHLASEKKSKTDSKAKQIQGSSLPTKLSSCPENTNLKKGASGEIKGAALHIQDSKGNGGASFVQSSPVVVQSPASLLPSQIVFAQSSSNSSMASSLPLLVSVTGVKTVNPLIFVQSNVVGPAPSLVYTHQRLAPRSGQARPIQPGPPSKTNRKLKKVPIPCLRQKSLLPSNAVLKLAGKVQNKDSKGPSLGVIISKKIRKNVKSKSSLKISKRKSKISPSLEKLNMSSDKTSSKCNNGDQESRNGEMSDVNVRKDVEVSDSAISVMSNSYRVPEIDKENVALNGGTPKIDCDSKTTNFSPFSTSTSNIVSEKVDIEKCGSVREKCCNEDSLSHPALGNKTMHTHNNACVSSKTSIHVVESNSTSSTNKCSAENDISLDNQKNSKCNLNVLQGAAKCVSDPANTNDLQHSEETSMNPSSAKSSKSNYSISALCAQQQMMQQPETTPLRDEGSRQIALESIPSKNSEALETRHLIHNSRINVSSEPTTESRNLHEICLNTEKSKEISLSSDQFVEWSEKCRGKGERSYPSYSLFSNFAVHTNKNSFIPINDMENFKPIPDTFDSSENSFGLPLNSSDISGDLFASLQVPPGGQHPESISPTAAFLLAFPLVSSSKATELLSDDAVCENTDSQSGMKTILQIGNLDGDTPVTKCVSVFTTTSADASSVVFREPNVFSHDGLTEVLPKSRSMDPPPVISFSEKEQNIVTHKVQNGSSKPSFPGKGIEMPLPKNAEELHSQGVSKQSCQSRNSSSGVGSAFSTIEDQPEIVEASRMQEKNQAKPSSLVSASSRSDILQKISVKSSSNHTQEATPYLTCQKQHDWSEVSATSQAVHTFTDFTTLSNTRTDCAVNFPIPSNITSLTNSSNVNGDAGSVGGPLYRAQPSSGNSILSWSTIPVLETTLPTKSHKLAPFQDTFPASKTSEKHNQSQATSSLLCANVSNSESGYHHQLGSSGFHMNDKLSSVTAPFTQDPNINFKAVPTSSSYGHGLVLDQKQTSITPEFSLSTRHNSAVNFSSPDKVIDQKKNYQSLAAAKQSTNVVCSASKVPKVSLRIASSHNYSHQSSELRNGTPQVSSSGLVFTAPVEGKQKSRDILSNSGSIMGVNHNLASKDSSVVAHFSQSTSMEELKSTGSPSAYPAIKEGGLHNPVMTLYGHEGNSIHKQQNEVGNNHFSQSVPDAINHKKESSHFNQNTATTLAVPKHITSASNFNMNPNNSVAQFSDSPVGAGNSQQQPLGKQQASAPQHQLQQRQPDQQPQQSQQNCVQTSKESSTGMMHRPPVNWMTAPDIRSHQHHNGPSFGNSSNMSATQGILYLPESESSGPSSVFDSSGNFHCIDVTHSGQSFYKGSEFHLFGNEGLENMHENSSWSPNKSGSSSMLGNMLIPSTLPTLVGDLALGDNTISRPFFPTFGNNNEPVSCPKKSRRVTHPFKRGEKTEELHASLSQECSGSFLSVSQLVDTSNVPKVRHNASLKESNPCSSHFTEQDNALCHTVTKQIPKSVSSNYSAEALLSTPSLQQINQSTFRKRRHPGATPYHNNYVTPGAPFHNNNNHTSQTQAAQTQFVSDVGTSRANDYQGTFIHTDSVSSFMLGAPSRPQRNHSYNVTNISERSILDDQPSSDRNLHPSADSNEASGAGRAARQRPNTSSSTVMTPSSSNIMDFGYINMQPAMLSEDISFTGHHPHPPPFLPPHTYNPQEALYPSSRLSMHHTSQNNSVQSPSATTLTNFHLSTIFPEINEKVIC